jgi:hypothetical protein
MAPLTQFLASTYLTDGEARAGVLGVDMAVEGLVNPLTWPEVFRAYILNRCDDDVRGYPTVEPVRQVSHDLPDTVLLVWPNRETAN